MRYFRLSFLSAILIALLVLPSSAKADVIVEKDTVTGTVIGKKKQPLPGAKVQIIGQPYSAFTDLDGRFNIKCERGAKKVLVSYPKARDVKKKIKPDMTVQVGRTWRQVPEKYQTFFGANIGVGVTSICADTPIYADIPNAQYDNHYDNNFYAPSISVMVGRVKAVGWYLKGFLTCSASGVDNDFIDDTAKAKSAGAILGGMVRLGCPLHLYLGGGFGYTDVTDSYFNNYGDDYNAFSWQIDMGLLFRIKDHCGINLSWNAGASKGADISTGSVFNLGFVYFLNK